MSFGLVNAPAVSQACARFSSPTDYAWSHIAVDFVTRLPPSNGNTTILTIVDHFTKAVHFVPLSKIPTATETADFLVLHVLWLHGIPLDIVFDHLSGVEILLPGSGRNGQSVLRLSSSDQQPDGMGQPGSGGYPKVCHGMSSSFSF